MTEEKKAAKTFEICWKFCALKYQFNKITENSIQL